MWFVILRFMVAVTERFLGATRCVIFVDDKSKYRDDPVFSRPLMMSMVTFVQSPRDRFPIEEVKSSLLDF